MDHRPPLWTGQAACHDENGRQVEQGEAEYHGCGDSGTGWPEPRFEPLDTHLVTDRATGLVWTRAAAISDFPLSWQEALEAVAEMNRQGRFGRNDWRLPNRRELRTLIDHSAKKPALPAGHPFADVFLGWYWTSTTAAIAPRYAWYVHFEGGRMFYGNKDGYYWVWPVAGHSEVLAATGQTRCFDEQGAMIPCRGSGQDGELRCGVSWPEPRFVRREPGIEDQLTGLVWQEQAGLGAGAASWRQALAAVRRLAESSGRPWRLPDINELESLVDSSTHNPALPAGHPFSDVAEAYWSVTSSGFDPAWAYVLYFHKGAVGVGFKKRPLFAVWPVYEQNSR